MADASEYALKFQLETCERRMRDLQDELNQIIREIKKSPDRSISTDPIALNKNAEVSLAIQEYLKAKSDYEHYVESTF